MALDPQPWPWPSPRVLIEEPDHARATAWAAGLRQAGYSVAVCPGPRVGERCPLVAAQACTAADGADAIVSSLGWSEPQARHVLEGLRRRHEHVPVIVEVTSAERCEWLEAFDGCFLVDAPVSPERLVTVVEQALGWREDSEPW